MIRDVKIETINFTINDFSNWNMISIIITQSSHGNNIHHSIGPCPKHMLLLTTILVTHTIPLLNISTQHSAFTSPLVPNIVYWTFFRESCWWRVKLFSAHLFIWKAFRKDWGLGPHSKFRAHTFLSSNLCIIKLTSDTF